MKVIAHSGTVIRIDKKGNAFHISSSILDEYSVDGMLGNFDYQSANDFGDNGNDLTQYTNSYV